jgi:hypothetical protein
MRGTRTGADGYCRIDEPKLVYTNTWYINNTCIQFVLTAVEAYEEKGRMRKGRQIRDSS